MCKKIEGKYLCSTFDIQKKIKMINNIQRLLFQDDDNNNSSDSAIAKSLAKPKAINLLKLAQKQNAEKMGLLEESVFEHDTSIKTNTPVAKGTPKSVESSIEQLSHGFDALHTDDSTDNEDEQTAMPYWTTKKNRLAIVIEQTNVNSKITDAFFDSKSQTVNSQEIFKLSAPIKRRRSTSIWNTPPRYSLLSKY